MQLIAPEILQETRGLSPAVSGTAMFVGLMLWLTGWTWHRFWVVLAVMHALSPASWDFPLIGFIAGGLAGLYLFRFWTMATTSLAGVWLIGYSGLCLADGLGKGKLDVVGLAENRAALLNWACAGLT